LVGGEWKDTKEYLNLVDPLTGNTMIRVPNTTVEEIQPFIDSLASCPKSGLHNPFKNKERYLMLAEVNRKVVECMNDHDVYNYFVKLV
jgi:1-pyrroline-5-carboxylate dehydrogenase